MMSKVGSVLMLFDIDTVDQHAEAQKAFPPNYLSFLTNFGKVLSPLDAL